MISRKSLRSFQDDNTVRYVILYFVFVIGNFLLVPSTTNYYFIFVFIVIIVYGPLNRFQQHAVELKIHWVVVMLLLLLLLFQTFNDNRECLCIFFNWISIYSSHIKILISPFFVMVQEQKE